MVTIPVPRQTQAPPAPIAGKSEPGNGGLLGCAAVLAVLLGMSVYGVLTAPNLKVDPGVGLLIYGAMFGIPLVLVLRAVLANKK